MRDPEVARFIDRVEQLPPGVLAEAFDHAARLRRSGGREASRALKLSASEFSELNHAVRTRLRPRADELDAFRTGLHADALSVTTIVARAIRMRAKITEEQYAVLVVPFTAAGVELPAHPLAGS